MDGEEFQDEGYCYPFARRAAKMLRIEDKVELSKELEAKLLDVGLGADDETLQAEVFAAVAVHGSRPSRARLLNLCERAGAVAPRIAAAEALLAAALLQRLELELVAKIDERHAEQLHAFIAFPLALSVAKGGTDEAVEKLAFKLSQNMDRRVMLGGMLAACDRGTMKNIIRSLLPEGHPVRQVGEGSASPIPRAALNDLGDVDTVRAAMRWLDRWLEPARRPGARTLMSLQLPA